MVVVGYTPDDAEGGGGGGRGYSKKVSKECTRGVCHDHA